MLPSVLRIEARAQSFEGPVEIEALPVPAGQTAHAIDLQTLATAAVGIEDDAESSFVQSAVVEATEQHEIVEIGFAASGPVFDMVGVAVLDGAAREATAAIAVVQGASRRRFS